MTSHRSHAGASPDFVFLLARTRAVALSVARGEAKELSVEPPAGVGAYFASALAAAAPARKAKVVVAADGCFRQRVRLPRAQMAGLSDADRRKALAFETEPFSGIAAADGELAFAECASDDPSYSVWDVVQAPSAWLAELSAAARAAGVTLVGATALPADSDPESALSAPFVSFRRENPVLGNPIRTGVALVAVALVVCAADFIFLRARAKALDPIVSEQLMLENRRSNLQRDVQRLRDDAQKLRTARAALKNAACEAAAKREAWTDLLDGVTRTCGASALLRSVSSDEPGRATLEILSLTAQEAGDTLSRLTRTLAPLGWSVKPGALSETLQGGSVRFDCEVSFTGKEAAK